MVLKDHLIVFIDQENYLISNGMKNNGIKAIATVSVSQLFTSTANLNPKSNLQPFSIRWTTLLIDWFIAISH